MIARPPILTTKNQNISQYDFTQNLVLIKNFSISYSITYVFICGWVKVFSRKPINKVYKIGDFGDRMYQVVLPYFVEKKHFVTGLYEILYDTS